jgi:hypothetical protein
MKNETDDARLERLRERTESLVPSAGFSDRVLGLVESLPRPNRPGKERMLALGLFAAAAAVAMFLSSGAQSSLDERAISSFDSVELEP